MNLDRRTFLRLSALAAASSVAGSRAHAAVDSGPGSAGDGILWNKAPCRFCGTGCHVQVGVKAGKVVAIQGDAEAEVNKGLLA